MHEYKNIPIAKKREQEKKTTDDRGQQVKKNGRLYHYDKKDVFIQKKKTNDHILKIFTPE